MECFRPGAGFDVYIRIVSVWSNLSRYCPSSYFLSIFVEGRGRENVYVELPSTLFGFTVAANASKIILLNTASVRELWGGHTIFAKLCTIYRVNDEWKEKKNIYKKE